MERIIAIVAKVWGRELAIMIITIILIISAQLSPLPVFSNHCPRCFYFTVKHKPQLKCSLALFVCFLQSGHCHMLLFLFSCHSHQMISLSFQILDHLLIATCYSLAFLSRTYSQCFPQPKFKEVKKQNQNNIASWWPSPIKS